MFPNIELINRASEFAFGARPQYAPAMDLPPTRRLRLRSQPGKFAWRMTAVHQAAARESLGRADLVLTTGGLGPTSDDITRDLIAQLLGRPLAAGCRRVGAHRRVTSRTKTRHAKSTKVQAMVLPGPCGPAKICTAPLRAWPSKSIPTPFATTIAPSWLILSAGPPRELRPCFPNRSSRLC